jgi:hypothetical protein
MTGNMMEMKKRRLIAAWTVSFIVILLIAFCASYSAYPPVEEFFCARYEPRGIDAVFGSLSGHDPSCLRNFLYDYQTLFTGALAILAATATVLVQIVTETKSQKRHEQLIALQTRADALRLERLIVPSLPILKQSADFFESESKKAGLKGGQQIEMVKLIGDELFARCRALQQEMAGGHWLDANDLFDGRISYAIEALNKQISDCLKLHGRLAHAFANKETLRQQEDAPAEWVFGQFLLNKAHVDSALASACSEVVPAFEELSRRIRGVADELNRLVTLYKLDSVHLTPSPDRS